LTIPKSIYNNYKPSRHQPSNQAVVTTTGAAAVTISDLRLYQRGQWSAAHLKADGTDIQSVILEKQGNTWNIGSRSSYLI